MFTKALNPSVIEALPPGTFGFWVGGAAKRMKNENFSMALMVSVPVTPSVAVTSFGSVANWHDCASSRSTGNASLVMPISTL